jgi:hypothetical protein
VVLDGLFSSPDIKGFEYKIMLNVSNNGKKIKRITKAPSARLS